MIMIQIKMFNYKKEIISIQIPKIIKLKFIKMMASIIKSSNQPQILIKK